MVGQKYQRKRPTETYTLTTTINENLQRQERTMTKKKPWESNILPQAEHNSLEEVKEEPSGVVWQEAAADIEASLVSRVSSQKVYDSDESDLCEVDLDQVLSSRLLSGG